jgi:nucleotide-binding universal stress UspA family protein
MSPNWITEQEERAGSEVLAESRAICEEASVPYESRVELGGIAATIERVTGEAGIDHIVMGTRRLGGVRGLLLGSVATKVLQLVNVPVTLVK